MKKATLFLGVLSFITLLSCKDSKKSEGALEVVTVETKKQEIFKSAETTVTFTDEKVAAVYQGYIGLKTALVNTDAVKTSSEAMNLMTALANVGVDESILTATQIIQDSKDVEEQRRAFVAVTTAVEKMIDGKIASGEVYKQYCPMAFDFKGGFWLSNSKEIYNPYFGSKMLRCGKVDSEIKN